VGYRRRPPGLRREEVAQLAGVGVTWYTWLEQGRPINASVQVLDAVARVLRLDAAEREHLYRLADLPEVARPGEREVIEPEVHTILAALTPLPAAVYSARYDLLAWNDAYAVVFPVIVAEPASTRNALWWLFTQPGCRSPLVDLERELSRMVATMRASFARHVGEPAWTSFIRRLSAASPEFARMWAMHDVAYHGRREKVFTHEEAGILRLTSTSLDLPSPPDTRLVAYTPTDDETRERLGRLMADHEAAAPRRSGGV
jgi:transcriptional regulator with XRE-family HTH domain